MNWILPIGSTLLLDGISQPLQIVRGIGGGSQGQVYEVRMDSQPLALKWYFPSFLRQDHHLRSRLAECIHAGEPSENFLWPLALLRGRDSVVGQVNPDDRGFGYLMKLRPQGYISAMQHYGGFINLSIASALKICFNLADAFNSLHSKGFCYKDISLGNLFMEHESGNILVCDNDNVDIEGQNQSAVLGTPGYMAPEILMGQAKPSRNSDLFSLAVLIFRLLTRHDPFHGKMERQIQCLDEPARRHLYGHDPVFIFHPSDGRNSPDPNDHKAALIMWPIYPKALQDLFLQTFVAGLRNPWLRTLTGQWRQEIATTLDQRFLCRTCGQENFPEMTAQFNHCWNCQSKQQLGASLYCGSSTIRVAEGNEIHPYHFSPFTEIRTNDPWGLVVCNPKQASILGLKNLSQEAWQAELSNGDTVVVPPGRATNLESTDRILTSRGKIKVIR